MERALICNRDPKQPVVCDVSGPDARLGGYMIMFQKLQTLWSTHSLDSVDAQLFSQAQRGNARAALGFLLLHQEEAQLVEVDVEEFRTISSERLVVQVQCDATGGAVPTTAGA
jgi:hypothetical protein